MQWLRSFRTGAITAAIVAATALGSVASAEQPKRGGTLNVAVEAEFSGFYHARARIFNNNTTNAVVSVLETLFVHEGDRIVPRLGLELIEAEDRMSAIVKLRQGVKFHDGTPFNADAVVHHYSWVLDPETKLNTAILRPVERVEKVDDYTVRFVLKHPWAALHSALALEHLLNFIGSPKALQDPDSFHRHPVGTGPFVFQEWRSGDRVVMTRNEDYWDKDLPYLDQVIYRIMPDGNTRFQSIRAGQIDIGMVSDPGHIVAARDADDLVLMRYTGSGGQSWNFNHSKPPFNDPRVRAAVVHAVDGQALVNAYYRGTTEVTKGLLYGDAWACPDLNWRSYDPEKARALAKEVGGIKFEHITTNTPAGRRLGSMLQHFFTEAGFETTLKTIEQSNNVRVGLSGDYQMDIWRFSDYGGDPDHLLSTYFSSPYVTRHNHEPFEELLSKARQESDHERRRELYCQVAQLMSDDATILLPVRLTYSGIARPYVKGVPPMMNNLIRVRAAWIDK